MKKTKQIITTLLLVLTLVGCKKEETKDDSTNSTTSGKFTVDGVTISGNCTAVAATGSGCSGKDVVISTTTQGEWQFIVYNMPLASSGVINFIDAYNLIGSCSLYVIMAKGSDAYITKSGSITKTGANSFTFSCVVYNILTNATKTVTGNGNY